MPDNQKPAVPSVDYHIAAKTHLWAVTTIRAVDDTFLTHYDAVAAGEADPESEFPPAVDILGQDLACIVCETPYDALARRRKCPGRRIHPGLKMRGK